MNDINPALSLIDSFSFVSGMGVNIQKSSVLSTSPPERLESVRAGLAQSPWPALPLQDKATYLGIVFGRNVTLEDIWEAPLKKALERITRARPYIRPLSLSDRVLYINIFIVSIFSYVGLFYIMPTEIWQTVRRAISLLVIPFNGGAFSYSSLVCGNHIFGLKIPLKDPWAFNIFLLASRSSLISSDLNYNDLVSPIIINSRLIHKHRDAAAVDFWRGRHLPDGTLVPLPR